jgi:aspartate racemase
MTDKIVGILGGFGPYATAEFFKRILDFTPAKKDWEHLRIIIDNNPKIPSRARAYLFGEASPIPGMLETIDNLQKAGCDFFICPCNTAHHFLDLMEGQYTLPLLNMVDLSVQKIIESGIKKVGLLGAEVTVLAKTYEKRLAPAGIDVINVEKLEDTRYIIEAGKQNQLFKEANVLAHKLISDFKAKGAEGIIFGCTEVPLVINSNEVDILVFDTMDILAKETVTYARELQ